MKIVFVGYVQFSAELFLTLLRCRDVELVGVITKKESGFNSDFFSLNKMARQHRIPCRFFEVSSQSELSQWIQALHADIVYCFGCSVLLSQELLSAVPRGVVGYHPAELPHNRGRHPIIWALALGLKRTASTFFMMNQGVDSGPIVSQNKVYISRRDDAATLYAKLLSVAKKQVVSMTRQLVRERFNFAPQNARLANVWRKRTAEDGRVDWRMSASGIYNLVRSLTRPYVGAHCIWNGCESKIWKVLPVKKAASNIEPGCVLKINKRKRAILVKCGDSQAVWVLQHGFKKLPDEGEYLR